MSANAKPRETAMPVRVEAGDIAGWRAAFPGLDRTVNGQPLAYLDNANTAQRPRVVIDAVSDYYLHHNANVARALHTLGSEATALYEGTRDKLARWINAASRDEVVFTRGTTEGINLVAHAWGAANIRAGDTIVLTTMEHHANIVPWQMLAARTGASIRVAPIDARGELVLDELFALLTPDVKLLAFAHVSNALGTINPVAAITREARARGITTLVDGSQALPHFRVDVQALGADFYVFTGHKMFGPTGTGALWARRATLDAMPPFMGGGEMIRTVSFDGTTYADPPHRFEAGTPNIAGIIGLGAAVDFLASLDFARVEAHEAALRDRATAALAAIPGLRRFGDAAHRVPVLSFAIAGSHPHDLATIIDADGIAVRSGHHCAHPLMQFFGVPSTARASLAFYNTADEVDRLAAALRRAQAMLA